MSYDVKAYQHMNIGQCWGHWALSKEKGIISGGPEETGNLEHRFIFLDIRERQGDALVQVPSCPIYTLLGCLISQFLQPRMIEGEFLKEALLSQRPGCMLDSLKGTLLVLVTIVLLGSRSPIGSRKIL